MEPLTLEPGTILRKDELIAIKTAPNVTAGQFYIFDPANGGGYTDGVAEGVLAEEGGWTVV